MLTGKDLPVVKEIHRRAWAWADSKGYDVRKQNGHEEIEVPDSSRWLIRSYHGTYGYDVSFGCVDEGWGVPPMAVDDGLEPALLERCEPQLLLTSTGHPKASPLMPIRRDAALAQLNDPTDVLLMDWGAPSDAQVGDRHAWRLASPHWTPERERLLESALRRLLSGADVDDDGLSPEESFAAQYLNRWPARDIARIRWLDDELVAACGAWQVDLAGPAVGAIEVSLDGLLWSGAVSDGQSVQTCPSRTLSEVTEWLAARQPVETLAHAAVISRLPADWTVRPVTIADAVSATGAFADAVRARTIRWDNPEPVQQQIAGVVTIAANGGQRVADKLSRGHVELAKCISWAFWRASTTPQQAAVIW